MKKSERSFIEYAFNGLSDLSEKLSSDDKAMIRLNSPEKLYTKINDHSYYSGLHARMGNKELANAHNEEGSKLSKLLFIGAKALDYKKAREKREKLQVHRTKHDNPTGLFSKMRKDRVK